LYIRAGAHTIGVAHCNTFAARLSGGGPNNSGGGGADPTLNAAYAAQLRARCGPAPAASSNNATAVPMDPGSPARFDAHYFVNLKLGRGLFASDAALLTDRRAAGMIHRLTRQGYFLQEFRNAVRKMGRVGVLTGDEGEIRRNCRVVNNVK
jgi:peroxidase